MIDEEKTFREKGYMSTELSKGSHKKVWRICDGCGEGRWISFQNCGDLCNKCAKKRNRKYDYSEVEDMVRSINEEKTFNEKGYRSSDLTIRSGKKVCAVCICCGGERWIPFYAYHDLCLKCSHTSEEFRKKQVELVTGRKHHECTKEKIRKLKKGKSLSKDHKIKIGDSQKAEKNHNWRGGVTSENNKFYNSFEYDDWRTAVFERDEYTCQDCGERGGTLNAHHILPLRDYRDPEYSLNVDNGITLCKKCHDETILKEYEFVDMYQKIVANKQRG